MRKRIRITEADIHRMVKTVLREAWYEKWENREREMRKKRQLEENCSVEAIYLPDGKIMFDFQDEYYNHEDFDEWCKITFYPDIDTEFNKPSYTIVDIDYDLDGSPEPSEEEVRNIIKQYHDEIYEEMATSAERYGCDLVY